MSETQAANERRYYLRRNADQMQDEISLIDLYQTLIKRKTVLIATLAAVVSLSVIYLIFAPKTFQVTAMLLEPTADQLVLTNRTVVNPNLDPNNSKALFVAKDVFEEYKVELKKYETWNLFVKANPDLFPNTSNKEPFRQSFNNPLAIAEDKDFPGPHILLEYDTRDQDKSAQVLTKYLDFARNQLTKRLIKQNKQMVEQKIATLELKIKTSRSSEKIKREDEITRLESDLAIAKKLNIKDNRMLALQDKTSLTVVASNMNVPRYMRGTKVLEAELEALKNRASDDAFIKGLREWQQEVSRLKLIQYIPENFAPHTLDGQINNPDAPIKPKRGLVLALSVVLGLFLGIFAAFFFEFIKKAGQSDS